MLNSQGHFRVTQGHFQVTSKKNRFFLDSVAYKE